MHQFGDVWFLFYAQLRYALSIIYASYLLFFISESLRLGYNHNSKSGSKFLINLGHSKSFSGIFGTEYKLQLNTNRVMNYLIKNEMEYREAFKYNYRSFIH